MGRRGFGSCSWPSKICSSAEVSENLQGKKLEVVSSPVHCQLFSEDLRGVFRRTHTIVLITTKKLLRGTSSAISKRHSLIWGEVIEM